MAKNYYDILGISSPEMRKHFKATDKAIEDLKNNMETVSKLSSAMLVDESTLETMTLEEIREYSLIKPIMLIDSEFNNCINLLWLSTIKKDCTVMGGRHYDELIFENDYMQKTITKWKETGEIGVAANELKPHAKSMTINYSEFSKNEGTGLYECMCEFPNSFGDCLDRIFMICEPIYNVQGNIAGHVPYTEKWYLNITASEDYVACITIHPDYVTISISKTTYDKLATQGSKGNLIIKGV